ncbi:MAG: RagB/SusD family nutrient uptake outer membrane protein [Chitinophagaceae bacterium]|nr:RagB/SusD family nutrient uptake outer membrane protein [Chitinophagaceae bacterium]
MKKMKLIESLLVVTLLLSFSSCKKIFDIKPEDQLDISNAYQNVYDADAAVIGVYGKFMGLAEQYVVLNELRGDLLDVTVNSNEALRQINTHEVKESNPYASPKPFYEVILNCNDVIENFRIMVRDKKMTEDQFNQRYSDVVALRSFLYLQLGIHWGEVPYVTSSLKNVDEVKNPTNYPKVTFNVLLDSLIAVTEAIPFKNVYPSGTNLNITVDGYPTEKFYINKRIMLGDLYLWKNNYQKAAEYYRQVMETATAGDFGENYYSQYKLGWWGTGNVDHDVVYTRPGDASTLVYNEGWRTIFENPFNSDGVRREWVWVLPFDSKFRPDNKLIKLFSPIGGDYQVQPSQRIYDMWDGQTQRSNDRGQGIPYDARKLLSTMNIGGQPVAMKFLYNYIGWNTSTASNPLLKNGKWFLFRQTHLHLRFAEAANRSGKYLLAWGLWNNGFAGAYPAPGSDVTNYHNTLREPYPFNFDGRNSNNGVPYYRADWYRNIGIRARANLLNVSIPVADSLLSIESGLIQEGALENAFEGTRWADLLRVTLRRNDPSFIADRVYEKLIKSGIASGSASAARARLMARDYYLPFKW